MENFGLPGTIRTSLVFYNAKEEIDKLVNGIQKAIKMLR
jgi:cysteine desulfurase/selenocysteine lyase